MSKYDLTIAEMEALYGPRHYTVYMMMFPNSKVYIGYTGLKPERRWRGDYALDISDAFKEFGKENISYFILDENLTLDEAHAQEAYWVEFYDARNFENGYNCLTGGAQKGSKANERTIQRNREAAIEQYSDPAMRKKASEAAIRRFSDPAEREKSRQRAIKRFSDPAEREKARQRAIKQFSDPAQREKARQSAIKRYSDPAQREKNRMAQVHYPVICIETGERFESCHVAENVMNINHGNITHVCRGNRHTAGGYHWKYA